MSHHKGHLPHIGGLSRHVGARDDGHPGVRRVQLRVVGHKQAVLQHLLHHRVAALPDEDLGACRSPPAGSSPAGQPQRPGSTAHPAGSHRRRSLLDPPGPLGDELPEAGEQLVFQGSDSVLCREHCGLQLLQLLGDVPLAVGQGLLSDVGAPAPGPGRTWTPRCNSRRPGYSPPSGCGCRSSPAPGPLWRQWSRLRHS